MANAGAQPAQQLVTLAGGQQIAVQMQPQVMQFPTAASTQQTMMQTVQIPVSQVSISYSNAHRELSLNLGKLINMPKLLLLYSLSEKEIKVSDCLLIIFDN